MEVEITPMDLVKEMKVMDKLGIVAPGIMEKDMETQKEKITQSLTTIQTLAEMFVLNSLINAQGKAISAKSQLNKSSRSKCYQVGRRVQKNVKYKAEEG